jgi:hypothetical protein
MFVNIDAELLQKCSTLKECFIIIYNPDVYCGSKNQKIITGKFVKDPPPEIQQKDIPKPALHYYDR